MYTIEHIKAIGGTDAMAFAHLALARMIKDDVIDGRQSSNSDTSQAVIARNNGKIVAIITFYFQEPGKYTWICGSYTNFLHRRKGLNTRLFKRVCTISRRGGMNCVSSLIKTTNKTMLIAAERQGRKAVMTLMEKEL